ncbi:murein transglycosylase A [Sphingosinicella sp. CPCC 101087]|uniref:murein transglycosylase A n=1 Tax=Sphingosinicella sp. CPCC 101087 TaxID=2497754 RepID=UPI00101CC50D|nr:murein transglycosylase A [Sphingosinicella sp. CPCC 101087]
MARSDSPLLTFRPLLLLGLLIAIGSCARTVPPPREAPPVPESPPEPEVALEAGVVAGPPIGALGISPAAAAAALQAFRISCPDLLRRDDASGLTRPSDWSTTCAAAGSWTEADASAFLAAHLEAVIVGDGNAFATGYYEPEIPGSRERRPGYDVPIYSKPGDLLDRNPLTGEAGRGRLDENGRYVLYYERADIEEGALAGRGLEIAWAADPVDLFFLQIQGSGRLRLPDGSVMRIGYAGQNGREYVAIGRLLRERGILESPITMQAIVDWLRANREAGRALMRENRSYVFFHELTGPGPLGSLGRPVTPRVSIAADPRFVPLGAPVVLAGMDNRLADGIWVAQDTGGAIRGANRFDTFWGAGTEAAEIAGGMSARGRAYLLLPRGTVARLAGRIDGATPQR